MADFASAAGNANIDPGLLGNPRRDIQIGSAVAILFFVIFLGWAAFARLDAAVHAQGTLVVAGQRQTVQHRDGGVVAQVLVKEGMRVEKGQLLIRLSSPEVTATERGLSSQAIRLLAQQARLQAEQNNDKSLARPAEFSTLSARYEPEIASAMRLQEKEILARYATLSTQRETLGQRGAQSRAQGQGFGEQASSVGVQIGLIDAQLSALRPVAAKGFVSQTRLRELERQRAELIGQRGHFAASISQAREAVRESRLQQMEADRSFAERSASELREVDSRLSDILPRLAAARDQLARTEIRAPATGTIIGLSIFTPGGVIQPGQRLMDIVPERQPLTIQAHISPDDADDLQVGQTTRVRFPSLHERDIPELKGVITQLSADKLNDERTGVSYFVADITVPPSEYKLLKRYRGERFHLRAGMPAEILVFLKKRTALDYALEPLLGGFWSSFTEH